jgi:hypothetical protein
MWQRPTLAKLALTMGSIVPQPSTVDSRYKGTGVRIILPL